MTPLVSLFTDLLVSNINEIGLSIDYDRGRGATSGERTIEAPFTGDHGWFLPTTSNTNAMPEPPNCAFVPRPLASSVKLTGVDQRNSEPLALMSFNLSDFTPCPHSQRSHFAEFGGWHFVAWELERVGDWIVNGEKSPQWGRRFELLQGPFLLPCRLMRVLRPIVQTFVRSMFDAGHDFPFCRCV
ncbi:hypothetical protein SULPSESMR1_00160 [Pseudosulfitobacter pseudonitzschiae]|uniref:Uncharacterized protein n=1 Tax=Pseudosulfitobacter pseudonitzschiae TaxID=1402135 RepID=A0A221JW81_9RHOB|nr:hypothetical protein SULPSESMR1_00160 [Pseudosulfitobacter pseudonitzschiae]